MSDNLGTGKISSLFMKMVIPSVISQLVVLIYNMVDRIFIGHIPDIGSTALTGVGICMPVTLIVGILLSAKQSEAVKKAFSHKVSIITGGPGTGKTTVQKVLLYINEKIGGGTVLLTAPTGRASRRMVESTGFSEGFTMHSALGLTNDEESEGSAEMLDADFIIADEFSMADMALSFQFFNHIRQGARLVLVGDVNQLPSVGPGSAASFPSLCLTWCSARRKTAGLP